MVEANEFVTVLELSEMLRMSKSGTYNLLYSRQIPHIIIGRRRYLIRREDVENYLQRNTIKAIKNTPVHD